MCPYAAFRVKICGKACLTEDVSGGMVNFMKRTHEYWNRKTVLGATAKMLKNEFPIVIKLPIFLDTSILLCYYVQWQL